MCIRDRLDSECPICSMFEKLENDAVEYAMGPSYMEDDIREKTDKMGFCSRHIKKIYEQNNRLGYALVMKTHMDYVIKQIESYRYDKGTGKKMCIRDRFYCKVSCELVNHCANHFKMPQLLSADICKQPGNFPVWHRISLRDEMCIRDRYRMGNLAECNLNCRIIGIFSARKCTHYHHYT